MSSTARPTSQPPPQPSPRLQQPARQLLPPVLAVVPEPGVYLGRTISASLPIALLFAGIALRLLFSVLCALHVSPHFSRRLVVLAGVTGFALAAAAGGDVAVADWFVSTYAVETGWMDMVSAIVHAARGAGAAGVSVLTVAALGRKVEGRAKAFTAYAVLGAMAVSLIASNAAIYTYTIIARSTLPAPPPVPTAPPSKTPWFQSTLSSADSGLLLLNLVAESIAALFTVAAFAALHRRMSGLRYTTNEASDDDNRLGSSKAVPAHRVRETTVHYLSTSTFLLHTQLVTAVVARLVYLATVVIVYMRGKDAFSYVSIGLLYTPVWASALELSVVVQCWHEIGVAGELSRAHQKAALFIDNLDPTFKTSSAGVSGGGGGGKVGGGAVGPAADYAAYQAQLTQKLSMGSLLTAVNRPSNTSLASSAAASASMPPPPPPPSSSSRRPSQSQVPFMPPMPPMSRQPSSTATATTTAPRPPTNAPPAATAMYNQPSSAQGSAASMPSNDLQLPVYHMSQLPSQSSLQSLMNHQFQAMSSSSSSTPAAAAGSHDSYGLPMPLTVQQQPSQTSLASQQQYDEYQQLYYQYEQELAELQRLQMQQMQQMQQAQQTQPTLQVHAQAGFLSSLPPPPLHSPST